jgi:hypothetical protein
MRNSQRNTLRALLLAVTPVFCLDIPLNAQNPPTQDNRAVQDNDTMRKDVVDFARFLDSHPEVAEQVRKNPSLLDNRQFVQNHPALETYLRNNPGVRDAIRQNPTAFMQREDSFDNDRDAHERDANMDDRDRDRSVAEFDHFLDSHREIAEQVRRDPSLLDNRQFVQNHPALGTYLQNNPGVRDDIRQNPNAFMEREDRFDRTQNGDRDLNRDHLASFGRFLDGHSNIAREVSDNPDRVKDQQYVDNHEELKAYLDANPDVRQDLMANPNGFVKGAQQFTNSGGTTGSGTNVSGNGTGTGTKGNSSAGSSTETPTAPTSKPKQ